mmetsp:Transcript_21165/g.34132  ORF Transcript_21165/g.34132 Transcript_21165/m.34132 type:complete len:91 (+) Transcript_21165:1766-2038(+)
MTILTQTDPKLDVTKNEISPCSYNRSRYRRSIRSIWSIKEAWIRTTSKTNEDGISNSSSVHSPTARQLDRRNFSSWSSPISLQLYFEFRA